MPLDGCLIAVEGIDGSGKTTLIHELELLLRKAGSDVRLLSFPDFDEPAFGPLIASFLRGELGGSRSVDPRLLALLFAANRAALRHEIVRLRADGATILCDRWVYSNIAFQSAKLPPSERGAFAAWVEHVEYQVFGLPRADITLWLDLPHRLRSRLREHRAYLQGTTDVHEEDEGLQETVADTYRAVAADRPDIVRLDAGTVDQRVVPEQLAARALKAIHAAVGTRTSRTVSV